MVVVYFITFHSKILHSFKKGNISSEGPWNLGPSLACEVFQQEGIFIVPHMQWHEALVFTFSSKGQPHLVALYDKPGVLRT